MFFFSILFGNMSLNQDQNIQHERVSNEEREERNELLRISGYKNLQTLAKNEIW